MQSLVALFFWNALQNLEYVWELFLKAGFTREIPYPARFILAVLFMDFVLWFQHLLKHEIPFLWRFHAIHHSQRQLNLLTDSRIHPVDYILLLFFSVLTFCVMGIALNHYLLFNFYLVWYVRFYHANLRMNFGVLRYLFVTPQSHRIHHSIDPKHLNKNYGILFSIWDRLFSTQHPDFKVYPATGIPDNEFPTEQVTPMRNRIWIPFRQILYSFKSLIK